MLRGGGMLSRMPATDIRMPTRTPADDIAHVEPGALERDLRQAVRGPVHFDDVHRAIYSTDASVYRIVPLGVVQPLDADDVVATVKVCARHRCPITPRGAGTALAGQVLAEHEFIHTIHRGVGTEGRRLGGSCRVRPGTASCR